MKKLSRALAITLLAATVPATIVLADPEPSDQKSEQSDVKRGPSPETLARLEDGRIAMAKAALKLSPDQEKLFAPVEEKIRAGFADRRKAREAWAAKREQFRAEKGKHERQQVSLPERIEKRSRAPDRGRRQDHRAGAEGQGVRRGPEAVLRVAVG